MLNWVVVVGHVYAIKGIPIGGILSTTCLAVVLGWQEVQWLAARTRHAALGFVYPGELLRELAWLRYADDTVMASYVWCSDCVFVFMTHAYGLKLSVVSQSHSAMAGHAWLDVELCVRKLCLVVRPPPT